MHIAQALSNIKGLSDAKVDKICEAAERIVVSITSTFASRTPLS